MRIDGSKYEKKFAQKLKQNANQLKQYVKSEGGKVAKDAKILGIFLLDYRRRPHINGAIAAVQEYKNSGSIGNALRNGYSEFKNTIKQNYSKLAELELPLSPVGYALKNSFSK